MDKKSRKTVLDDLRGAARRMVELGNSIAKTADAISIDSSWEGAWLVHMTSERFNELFADQEAVLGDRPSKVYPFEKSILIEGIKFYHILAKKDLTEEERKTWITDVPDKKREEG